MPYSTLFAAQQSVISKAHDEQDVTLLNLYGIEQLCT